MKTELESVKSMLSRGLRLFLLMLPPSLDSKNGVLLSLKSKILLPESNNDNTGGSSRPGATPVSANVPNSQNQYFPPYSDKTAEVVMNE